MGFAPNIWEFSLINKLQKQGKTVVKRKKGLPLWEASGGERGIRKLSLSYKPIGITCSVNAVAHFVAYTKYSMNSGSEMVFRKPHPGIFTISKKKKRCKKERPRRTLPIRISRSFLHVLR